MTVTITDETAVIISQALRRIPICAAYAELDAALTEAIAKAAEPEAPDHIADVGKKVPFGLAHLTERFRKLIGKPKTGTIGSQAFPIRWVEP